MSSAGTISRFSIPRLAHGAVGFLTRPSGLAAVLVSVGLVVSGSVLAQPAPNWVEANYAGTQSGDWGGQKNAFVGPANNVCASMGSTQNKNNLVSNFGFTIPGDATIVGVTAHVKSSAGNPGADPQIVGVQLASNATVEPPALLGTSRDFAVPVNGNNCADTIDASLDGGLGGWGLGSLPVSTVNNSTFGMEFVKKESSNVKLDAVCLEIEYTLEEGTGSQESCFAPPELNTITVEKVVVGTAPGTDWGFSGTPDIGAFTLPAAGGFETFEDLVNDTYSITETLKAGYTMTWACSVDGAPQSSGSTNPATVTVADGEIANCVFTNTLNTGTFTVSKTYNDATVTPVTITASCTGGGTFVANPLPAAPGAPAVFTYQGFTGNPTCTATESNVPPGYTANNADCKDNDALGTGCTIANTLNTGTFTVNKDFSDNNQASVSVTATCTSGTVTNNPQPASEASPAVFNVQGFVPGATCKATEGAAPGGYAKDESDCQDGDPINGDGCTIVNTVTGNFTVFKTYKDGNQAAVLVTASCTGGGIFAKNPLPAAPGAPAIFTYYRYTGNPTCTAVESEVPVGYEPDNSDCQDNDPLGETCTIVNDPNARFKVTKTFADGNTAQVTADIQCNNGLPSSDSAPVTGGDPIGHTFVVTNVVDPDITCVITESGGPGGYSSNHPDGCTFNNVRAGNYECAFVNTPKPVTVRVDKIWEVPYEAGGPDVSMKAKLKIYCDGTFKGKKTVDGDGYLEVTHTPLYPSSSCYAKETNAQSRSGVEQQNLGCGSESSPGMTISAGHGASCKFVNTVFFEGIPTLNQYGLALLALLMLGVGFVGFRRFV